MIYLYKPRSGSTYTYKRNTKGLVVYVLTQRVMDCAATKVIFTELVTQEGRKLGICH